MDAKNCSVQNTPTAINTMDKSEHVLKHLHVVFYTLTFFQRASNHLIVCKENLRKYTACQNGVRPIDIESVSGFCVKG